MAIYKRGRGPGLGATKNKSNKSPDSDKHLSQKVNQLQKIAVVTRRYKRILFFCTTILMQTRKRELVSLQRFELLKVETKSALCIMLFFITSVSLPEIAGERSESRRVEIIARQKEVGHLSLDNEVFIISFVLY